MTSKYSFQKLTAIVDTLLGDDGCPWDRVQTRQSLKPFLIEETYETLEALDTNDPEKIKDELGDLLYQILFHAKISEMSGEFDIHDVVNSIAEKMVRRHPHIFENAKANTPDQVLSQWEDIKKKEKNHEERKSILDGIPNDLPANMRAQKLQKKAAKVGFDWPDKKQVLGKLDEEIAEFKEAVATKDPALMEDEMGDMLFVMVNLARHLKIDAEEALRRTNQKFIRRFQYIEKKAQEQNRELKDMTLSEMESLWQLAKGQAN